MIRFWVRAVLVAALVWQLSATGALAATEKRVALVIGNGGYEKAALLANPPKDAKAVAEMLRELGFDVVEGYDLTLDPMVHKVRDFGHKATDADMAMVFYAGHGVQVNGINYLLPVDAKLADERDLSREAIAVEEVMRELRNARGARVVILDACRDNPFVSRMTRSLGTRSASVGRGFARVQTEGGSVVAYATKEDAVAEDGKGDHSPYTQALLKHMQTPGLELRLMFGRVASSVKESTAGRQEPFIYDGLGGNEVYLKPAAAPAPAATATPAPAATTGADPYEITFWDSIKNSTSPADYRAYLEAFPNGRFAPLARVRANPAEPTSQPAAPSTPPAGQAALAPPPKPSALPTPADTEAELGLTPAKRKEVEEALRTLGFRPGRSGDTFTADSRKALADYQKARELEPTGYLTPAVFKRILGEAEEARKAKAAAKPPAPAAPKPAAATGEMVDCLLPDSSTAVLSRTACRAKSGLVMGTR